MPGDRQSNALDCSSFRKFDERNETDLIGIGLPLHDDVADETLLNPDDSMGAFKQADEFVPR